MRYWSASSQCVLKPKELGILYRENVMVMTCIYKYQALIAGLLGFLGICITLCLNARLARKMRQDEIAQKRQTLRVALLEEIKEIRRDMNDAVPSLDGTSPAK